MGRILAKEGSLRLRRPWLWRSVLLFSQKLPTQVGLPTREGDGEPQAPSAPCLACRKLSVGQKARWGWLPGKAGFRLGAVPPNALAHRQPNSSW